MDLLNKIIFTIIILVVFFFFFNYESDGEPKINYVFTKDMEFNETNTQSVVSGDYDNDGDLDLVFGKKLGQNYIYIKQANNTYVRKPEFGTKKTSYLAFADFDNDGDLDLATGNGNNGNELHINYQNGKNFLKEDQFGEANKSSTSFVAWGDYDNDNDLDMYVCNLYDKNQLYENLGNYFSKGRNIGVHSSYCAAWGDYDNDGDMDLALGNLGQNYLYLNNGNGTFNIIKKFGEGLTYYIAWGDYDNDNDLDLAVANDGQNYLYKNENNDFIEIPNFGNKRTLCLEWGDYNNDGNLDLAIGNEGGNSLYTNNGQGYFIESSRFGNNITRSIVWGDYNNDGNLDILVGNSDGYSAIYIYEKDKDNDGIGDSEDVFPNDPSASVDFDNDGYPENWNFEKNKSDSTTGLYLDEFPDDPKEWRDSDGDGIGDNRDPIDFMENSLFFTIIFFTLFIPIIPIILLVKDYESNKLKNDDYMIKSSVKQKTNFQDINKSKNLLEPKTIKKKGPIKESNMDFLNFIEFRKEVKNNLKKENMQNVKEVKKLKDNENPKKKSEKNKFISNPKIDDKFQELIGKHLFNTEGILFGIIEDVIYKPNKARISEFIVTPTDSNFIQDYEKYDTSKIIVPINSIISTTDIVLVETTS